MKKFAMAAVAAAALSAGVAQAYTVGTFQNGFVVPNVIHNGDADTTAVGIINQTPNVVPVFWTFFDQNSNHITDGCFPLTSKDYEPFIWSQQSGGGLAGKRGYLVFAAGAQPVGITVANACAVANAAGGVQAALLSANAFQVNVPAQDVAVIPVIDGPLAIATDLTIMGPLSLTSVAGAAAVPAGGGVATFSMRYAVDAVADAGLETRIVVWSTGDHRGTHTVNMYDDKQNRKSVNFALAEAELSYFNPETIPGRPAAFVDGFIEWNAAAAVPADFPGVAGTDLFTLGGSAFTYSLISAPAFGAVQSVLGSHQ